MDFKVKLKHWLNQEIGMYPPREWGAGYLKGGIRGIIIGCLIGVIMGLIKGNLLLTIVICIFAGWLLGGAIGQLKAGKGEVFIEAFLDLIAMIKRIFLFIFHLFNSGRQKEK